MKTPKIATLRIQYNSMPSGSMVSLGQKVKENGITLYECFNSILQKNTNSIGFIPSNLLNI